MNNKINLIDNSSLKGREAKFSLIEVDLNKIVKEWKTSLFSFEWLLPDGSIRDINDLSTNYAEQFQNIENSYKHNEPLERPVLGIGMMDNIEIGSRKEVLLTLHKLGIKRIDVHIPNSCIKDFQKFM